MQIYVITGSSGCYEDYTEWMVESYINEETAIKRIEQLNDLMSEIGFDSITDWNVNLLVSQMRDHEFGDKEFLWLGTDPNYSIKSIQLVDL